MNRLLLAFLATSIGMLVPANVSAQNQQRARTQGDSAAVAAVVHAFGEALEKADTATVRRLLADHVRILEGGSIEDREHYMSGHMTADMAFAQAVPSRTDRLEIFLRGDVAWAVSRSVRQGRYRDRDVDSQGVELMILERVSGEWRIAGVHWSSSNRR